MRDVATTKSKRKYTFVIWVVTCIIIILVVCAVTFLTCFLCERRRRVELKKFLKGDPKSIDWNGLINEQANLLPCRKKYEISRKRLTLIKELGEGFFGIVHEGFAKDIFSHEKRTKVAIKIAKKLNDEVRAFRFLEVKLFTHSCV